MIHTGDCIEVMATMDAESIDAIVTDPPYGIGFMGKAWDGADIARRALRRAEQKQESLQRATPGRKPRLSLAEAAGQYDLRPAAMRAYQDWCLEWATEALRVAKPSAYLLSFGGTRTAHRMACAIEDAGWIIRDMLVWAYASGFPKGRANLKPAWEPIVMARKPGPLQMLAIDACRIVSGPTAIMDAWESDPSLCVSCAADADSPARRGTSATRGSTTRKPAAQPPNGSGTPGDTNRPGTGCSHGMTAARAGSSSSTAGSGRTPTGLFLPDTSSTISTRTSSTTGWRTCTCCGGPITPTTTSGTRSDTETGPRAPTTSESTGSEREPSRAGEASAGRRYADEPGDFAALPGPRGGSVDGRWPSNIVLTDPIFDGGWDGVVGGGEAGGGFGQRGATENVGVAQGMFGIPATDETVGYGDSGTYSRFFLVPKAARSDREPVLGGLEVERDMNGSPVRNARCVKCGRVKFAAADARCQCVKPEWTASSTGRANSHPTVKPIDLMRHLVRLVTPLGGTVLDPFLGSGTTALAAEQEGFAWIGIEREAEYVAIAEARLNGTQKGLAL